MRFSIIETEVNPGSELRNFLVVKDTSDKITEDNWILSFKHTEIDTLQEVASRYLVAYGVISSLFISLEQSALLALAEETGNTSISS